MTSSPNRPRDCEGPPRLVPPQQNSDTTVYRWLEPLAGFTLVSEDGADVRHEGRGLTLEQVLGWERRDVEPEGTGEYDLVVFRDGLALAVIHRRGGRPTTVTRLDRPAAAEVSDA